MSLVNRMLRDLEERHAFAGAPPHEALGGLHSAQEYAQSVTGSRARLWLGGSLLLVAAAVLVVAMKPAHLGLHAPPGTPAPEVAAMPLPPPARASDGQLRLKFDLLPELASLPASGPVRAVPSPAARVLYFTHDSSMLGADIVLAVAGRPEYAVDLPEGPPRLRLDLRNTEAGDLAAGFVPAGILSGVTQSAGPEGLTVIFDLASPVVIDAAELREGGDHQELHIRVTSLSAVPLEAQVETEAAETVQAPAMVKRPVRQEAPARDAFREGIAASRQGDVAAAIGHLYEALSRDPGHLEARRTLVALLLEQGDRASAKRLAMEGLEAHPADPVLRKAYARLLLEGGETDSAVAILVRSPPALETDPDYYALMAAALQQQGRHPQSAELYARLVRLDGTRSEWWAGLGISLDALGRGAEALEAFRRVQRDAAVPEALRRYVAERIRALAGGAG